MKTRTMNDLKTGNEEIYTPLHIVQAAHKIMGGIDLDPASCEHANRTVKARNYYTKEDNGLMHNWEGRVFLNPPYGRGTVRQFVELWCSEPFDQGILLVNVMLDTPWGQTLLGVADIICFHRRRVVFDLPDGTPWHGSAWGQMIAGRGVDIPKFYDAFSSMGKCVLPV